MTTVQLATSCKSRQPEIIAPANDTESNIHPMDWGKDIAQTADRDSQLFIVLGSNIFTKLGRLTNL